MPSSLASGCLLLALASAPAQTDAPEAAAQAVQYLEAALDQIEQGSGVYSADWNALRITARAKVASTGAQTTADTYPAIREALATLGDKHALLIEPEDVPGFNPPRTTQATGLLVAPPDAVVALVLPNSPAAAAGLVPGDRIVGLEVLPEFSALPRREFDRLFRGGVRPDGGAAPLDLQVRSGTAEPRAVHVALATFDDHRAPSGFRLDGDIGYLELPALRPGPEAATYDDAVHALLDQLDAGTLRGCIVDLRRNTGGSVWPMLAGIGPLAGEGRLGAFTSATGAADWSYDAAAGMATSEGYELARVAVPHPLRADLPVAVLTGPLTTGAGEAIAVAFAGRPHSRRFGEGTRGLPTSNTQIPLADGALLLLTVTVHADRTGTRYEEVIPPDEQVATDWSRFGTADDPVVAAACLWLAGAHGE
jgi:carboxyl-terminal processing protease